MAATTLTRLRRRRRAVHRQQALIDVVAREQVRARRAHHVDVLERDVATHVGARAHQVADERVVLVGRGALEVLDEDVGDGQVGGILVAEGEVLLTVALSDLDGVVDVGDGHGVVGDVVDGAEAAAALEVAGQGRRGARPHLDAGAVAGVGHADVVDVDVLDIVDLAGVLAQRADRDAVAAVAPQVLHDDLGAVGLEGHAVVAVVDVRVLDHDVAAAVRVPAVRVLGRVLGHGAARDVDVGEDDVGAVGDQVVPLRAVAQLQVRDGAALEADGAEQDGPEDVDVLGVQVVPHLAVAVERAAAVDVHVFAAQLEEGSGILEDLLEGIGLPVVGVIGELERALDDCVIGQNWCTLLWSVANWLRSDLPLVSCS